MIYVFFNVYPDCGQLLSKDIIHTQVECLLNNTLVDYDKTFDSSDVVDMASLIAADKLQKDFETHQISARMVLTRSFPRPKSQWNLVVELPRRISGIESVVSRFLRFDRMEYQELLTYNEVLDN